jgi:signal transduction histidine kinase
MGLVVAGIGLTGTAYVVGYLHERMTAHGIEHNREIAQRLHPLLAPRIEVDADIVSNAFQDAVTQYGSFGYRIFLLDRRNRLVADSHRESVLPVELEKSWLADITLFSANDSGHELGVGAAKATDEDSHPMLIWLEKIDGEEAPSDQWLLGVASDQHKLNDFLGELHWHLDGILLVTYIMIGFLGLFAMRGIGRAYERKLEAQVQERTLALKLAHDDVLEKTRLATIGQTASVLAHEMRNPLASIKLALSGMSGQESLSDRSRRRVELVTGEVDRLDALLSQTLDYVRPINLSTRPILLDQLISKVEEQQQPLFTEHGITLRRQLCAECAAIRLDEDKMHQVLLNLLKNAVEASPEGGEIGLRLLRDNVNHVVIEITNGGEPIDAETADRAFDPFFTTKPRGSGLGLGLVKRIIEEHGGKVTIDGNPSGGTRVRVYLPMGND